jgi:hypothetical protein
MEMGMASPNFKARPLSAFEMAGQKYLMLDGLVQVKGCVNACSMGFGFHKLANMPSSRLSAS